MPISNDSAAYHIMNGYRCLRNIPKQTTDLYLAHCGIEQCAPNQSYGPRLRHEYHLHFILDGGGTYQIEGHSYHLTKGQLFLLPPGVETFYFADNENPWHYTWVSFSGHMAEHYLEQCGFAKGIYVLDCQRDPQEFLRLTRKILDSHELTAANEVKRIGFLYTILALLMESYTESISCQNTSQYDYSQDTYVEHALQYISENYINLHVQEIADYIGINRSYLTTIFKKCLHISPQEYLMQFRLKKAAEMLRYAPLPVQSVASQVDYQDPLSFSRTFKNFFGSSPKKYREEFLNKTGTS